VIGEEPEHHLDERFGFALGTGRLGAFANDCVASGGRRTWAPVVIVAVVPVG
jgi:hypothetical protein